MIRFAFCLFLALLTCGCQVALTSHMPADLELDPVWSRFSPPLTAAERGGLPDVVADLPADIPRDPLAGIAPDGTRGSELAPLPYAPGPHRPAPPAGLTPVVVPDPVVASIPEGVDPEDPFEDVPVGPAPVPVPALPALPERPAQPAPAVGPAADSNDLGAPPSGKTASPLPPSGIRTPVRVDPIDVPDPSGMSSDPRPVPSAGSSPRVDYDPFAPTAPITLPRPPDLPAPVPVAPTLLPAGAPSHTVEDDPFGGGSRGSGTPLPVPALPVPPRPDVVPAPGLPAPTDPILSGPKNSTDAAGDDPFAAAQSGPRFSSSDPGERAQEQATRLFDDPGNPRIQGYPRQVLMLSDAWVALRPGPRPVVVVFYDDARRASDLMAGEILPVLAAHQREVDIVAINRGAGAKPDKYELALARQLLEGAEDTVPVLVVQDANRKLLLARFTRFPGSELERVLATGRSLRTGPRAIEPTVPTIPAPTAIGDTPRAPDPFSRPGPEQPTRPTTPPATAVDPNLPPAGLPSDPLGAPPAGAREPFGNTPVRPRPDQPAPATPVAPTRPNRTDPLAPAVAGPERAAPVFSTPDRQAAERHAARLRENPGQTQLGGYPRSLLPGSRPEVALQPGHRPVVIVFYDNASRASNLQAADVLPVLVEAQATADVITIDVAKGAKRTASESKVVKPYYPGSVPAIVVLSPARAPVKLWFQRISARALRAAIEQATRVR